MSERRESIFDELEEVEEAIQADATVDAQILAALGVVNRNQIAIGQIAFARFDNLDQAIRDLAALVGAPPAAGDAVTGTITLNGVEAVSTGENTFMATIRDDDPGATLEVTWDDAKGAKTEPNSEAFTVDGDATVTQDTTNPDKAILVPGTAKNADGTPATINVTIVGTNADGTQATLTVAVDVTPGDAVGGTVAVTPGAAAVVAGSGGTVAVTPTA